MARASDEKVQVGWQTIVGYTTGATTFLTPLIAWLGEQDLAVPVQVALLAAGAVVTAVTNKGRSDQAVELIRKQTELAVVTPIAGGATHDPADP